MGTGTEVTQEAAVMILTDDNFFTIVKAVELGRGLYDNLARYVRFKIGGLFAYIATFLGASIFNIAEGIPLLPLQTLWVSFTMLSIQAVGLGYSKPAAGLMERPPLPPARPILTRALIAWLAFVGLLMAAGALGVISRADQAHGLAVARTMGMVTFALFILFFSIESKNEREPAFSLGTFSDKMFVITTSGSFVLLVLSTVLGIFQTVIKTARLDVRQWLICTAVALSIVAAAEIRKAAPRQTAAKAIHRASGPGPQPPGERPSGAYMAGYAPVWQMAAGISRRRQGGSLVAGAARARGVPRLPRSRQEAEGSARLSRWPTGPAGSRPSLSRRPPSCRQRRTRPRCRPPCCGPGGSPFPAPPDHARRVKLGAGNTP
jgi:hypothetical protein